MAEMDFWQYISSLPSWEIGALFILFLILIYGVLCFVFSPITQRLDKIEKAIKDGNKIKSKEEHDK